ncbi:sensor histidine kinase [Bacillus infantis]|nr:HAMP domain-containing sensor histidine kinase [Bacillus infantis]
MQDMMLKNRLFFKLLGSIAISFVASFLVMVLLSQMIFRVYDVKFLTELSVPIYNVTMFLFFTIIILSFILVFLLLVRKKIFYLKMISDRVQEIAGGQLGLTIHIKGKDELSQLAGNINFMSKELESRFEHERSLENAKNELITNVSHDLRTPLTSIIGYLDLLRKGQYQDSTELKEYLETTYSKSQRLKSLMNELLEYTRLASPDVLLNMDKVDLSALLRQMAGEYMPIMERELLTVHSSITGEPVRILMDVEMMVRVYENLFSNSIKYSTKPSSIELSLNAEGSMAVLKISNRTDKPPVADLNQLFDRFVVGEKARTENQGTGLGLAISKRIVELHGGKIYAEYAEGWMTVVVEHQI